MTNKLTPKDEALALWKQVPAEKQQELRQELEKRFPAVIELETLSKKARIFPVAFGLHFDKNCRYLSKSDIPQPQPLQENKTSD